MRITRLEAKNIGPFSDLAIDFKEKQIKDKAEIHILTGENGTGKSTILMMLASIADKDNDNFLIKRLHSIVNLEGKPLSTGYYGVNYYDKNFPNYNKTDRGTNDHIFSPFEKSNLFFQPNFPINSRIHSIFKNNNRVRYAIFAYSGYRNVITEIKKDKVNPFNNAVNFYKSVNYSNVLKWIAEIKTKEAISLTKGQISKSTNISRNLSRIENILSKIIDKNIEFDLTENLEIKIKYGNKYLDFDVLPDGIKSIISWLSDLFMRLDLIEWDYIPSDRLDFEASFQQNFILFLDEIEVHLHPAWQRKILPVVQELFPNAQIFISTHSPFVVGSVDGAWVYNFKLDENNNSYLEKEPYLTEDGHSYDRILEETFGIKERFGVGVQAQLEKFKEYKNKILAGENVDNEAFMKLAKEIADQSIELNSTIGFEIRQIERLTKKTLETV